jgi:Kelch motif
MIHTRWTAAPLCLLATMGVAGLVASGRGTSADGQGERAAETPKRRGPLAGLPSAPGPHIEKIKALGDDEWLDLGSPAADSRWGKGRGCSWGAKMPYAPDLHGAFLAGQGQHGFIKPDGRYDDFFFYDINAHRWICLYPGLDTCSFAADVRKGGLKLNDDGQLADRDGQPVIYAYGGHSYQTHTYDTDLRKYVSFGGGSGLGGEQYSRQMAWDKEAKKLLAEQQKSKPDRINGSPFSFNTATGKFERYPIDGLKPAGSFPNVFYLPTKKSIWHYAGGPTLLGDGATRRWTDAHARGPTPPGIDFGACYDSKRDHIYLCGGSYRGPYRKGEGKVYAYDVKSNTWSNLPDKGDIPSCFDSNDACVHYDTANDRVITVIHPGGNIREAKAGVVGVFAFDPETGAWGEGPAPLPAKMASGCWSGFYSPELNAHFFHVAGDSQDNGTMWVYRYKKAATN